LGTGPQVRNLSKYEGPLRIDERLVDFIIEAADALQEVVVVKGPIAQTAQQELLPPEGKSR